MPWGCGKCFQWLLAIIDSLMANGEKACSTLKNTLFKGFVLHDSLEEKLLGCFGRKG